MSSRRRRRRREGGPATVAGLLRFFEEAEGALKISPRLIILLTLLFIVTIAVLNFLMPYGR